MMETFPPVVIEWTDSSADAEHGWTEFDDVESEVTTLFSAGFLWNETPTTYVLARSIDEDNERVEGILRIPKSAVVSYTQHRHPAGCSRPKAPR